MIKENLIYKTKEYYNIKPKILNTKNDKILTS